MRSDLAPLARIFALLRPHRARCVAAALALVFGTAISLLYPQMLRSAIDTGLSGGSTVALDRVALASLLIFAVQAGVLWLRAYLLGSLGARAVAELRKAAFDRLLAMPLAWFHEHRSGELVGRLSNDVDEVESFVENELAAALKNALQALGGLIFLFLQNTRLTLVMIALVPVLSVSMVVLGRRIRGMSRAVQDELAAANADAQEIVAAMQTVQSFAGEARESRRYALRVEAVFASSLRLAGGRAGFVAVTTFASCLAVAAIVWTGGRSVIDGELSGGELLAFGAYTMLVAASLGGLADLFGSLQRVAGASERIYELIDAVSSIRDAADARPLPEGRGALCFEEVSFAYPSRRDRAVLDRVSFSVVPGEVVALVGASGSGKSTLAALLFRFFDPDAGRLLFEGEDLRALRLGELRRALAIVAQEPVLFSGTIRENIAYGSPEAARVPGAVERAARDAYADTFIESFAAGYETVVGERGVKLSGGQRQRIAVARALLANPRVLVLDEATSNLDAESEWLVQRALARLMRGRTTLVIAHRLSTVREADRIIVLDRGAVMEMGAHAELMARRGAYHRLVEHQLMDGSDRELGGAA